MVYVRQMETRYQRLKKLITVNDPSTCDPDGTIALALRDIGDLKHSLQLADEGAQALSSRIARRCEHILEAT
jgi:hypothetical protein